jgi:disulfide bond formation protein DsbB
VIGQTIGFLLRNLPAVLLGAALVLAATRSTPEKTAERYLGWILLLPIGVTGLWAGAFHVFFPATSAAHIGWQVGPFEFEVGMADFAIGVTACLAFWRELAFKAVAVCAASVFLLGDAVGHVRDMMVAGNFAPGNAGLPFYMDIICPLLAVGLLTIATQQGARD